MAKKENEIEMPPLEVPSITKIITCEKCGTKTKVEFEIDLAPLLPIVAGGLCPSEAKKIEEEETAELEIEK